MDHALSDPHLHCPGGIGVVCACGCGAAGDTEIATAREERGSECSVVRVDGECGLGLGLKLERGRGCSVVSCECGRGVTWDICNLDVKFNDQ